ncbi:MAG: hypothetical protein JWO36_4962 [Myxococcales bacterium]|nr:hypothetical protein [Myxococcales bacterium]
MTTRTIPLRGFASAIGLAALAAGMLLHAHAAVAGDDDENYWRVKPEAGREAIKPMKPDWCEPNHEVNSGCDNHCQERTIRSAIQRDVGSGLEMDLKRVANLACDFPDSAYVQQQVAYWRQDWVNHTAISEKEDRDLLKAMIDRDASDKLQADYCATLEPTAPVESALYSHQREIKTALGCEHKFLEMFKFEGNYPWMDRPDLPQSEIVRAWSIVECLNNDVNAQHTNYEGYANCVGDIHLLDRKKLDAEIAALKLNPLGRVRASELYGIAKIRADAWTARISKNPAEKKVLIDVPLAAFNAWNKDVYEPHKALFDAAYAIEDKSFTIETNELAAKAHPMGCAELRAGIHEYINSKKSKTKADVIAAASDAVGYPLIERLALCDGAEGRYTSAAGELALLRQKGSRMRQGPRLAAHWAAFDAALESPTTDSMAHLIPPIEDHNDTVFHRAEFTTGGHAGGRFSLEDQTGDEGISRDHVIEQGKVVTVKKTKDGTLVTFKKEKWFEPTWSCTEGRVINYESDGTPIRSRNCVQVGSHEVTYQLEPHLFDEASNVASLKPGVIAKCIYAGEKVGEAHRGFLVGIDKPGAGKKTPTAVEYFGAPLK